MVSYSFNAMDVFGHGPADAPQNWGAVHPDDLPLASANAQKAIEARDAYEATLRMIRPDTNCRVRFTDTAGNVHVRWPVPAMSRSEQRWFCRAGSVRDGGP